MTHLRAAWLSVAAIVLAVLAFTPIAGLSARTYAAARGGADPREGMADPDDFARRVLAAHNRERARLGLAPLRWDPRLSERAMQWAQVLALHDTLEHSGDWGLGENLWMGSARWYTPEQMIEDFIAERTAFRPGRFPDVSRTGDWSDVGHYTQVIWPETRAVGCALARNARDEVMVCRYWPAGNVLGERVPG